MITRKHILFGGVAVEIAVAIYLLVVSPIYAGMMALGAIGAGIYMQLLATLAPENKNKFTTAPEEEWTGI